MTTTTYIVTHDYLSETGDATEQSSYGPFWDRLSAIAHATYLETLPYSTAEVLELHPTHDTMDLQPLRLERAKVQSLTRIRHIEAVEKRASAAATAAYDVAYAMTYQEQGDALHFFEEVGHETLNIKARAVAAAAYTAAYAAIIEAN